MIKDYIDEMMILSTKSHNETLEVLHNQLENLKIMIMTKNEEGLKNTINRTDKFINKIIENNKKYIENIKRSATTANQNTSKQI